MQQVILLLELWTLLDASSFTPIDTVAPVANTTWEEIEVKL